MPSIHQITAHANDIALVIYTVALVAWGWIFAVVLRKKWGSWRHSHREPLTADEWILIGVLLAGLVLGVVYMLTFLHGRPPGTRALEGIIFRATQHPVLYRATAVRG